MFQEQVDNLRREMAKFNPEKKILKKLDLFVLDNSLRETGFGHLRGHTLEDKWKIYNEVKKAGFKNIIVESINHMTHIGDTFIRQLISRRDSDINYFAFTDFIERIDDKKVPDDADLPTGLQKMKDLGIRNIIIELDLVYHGIDYNVFNGKKLCSLLSRRFEWVRKHLSRNALIFVNIRDFSECMMVNPRRLFYVVNYLSSLHASERIFGIAFEEAGERMPEELAVWTNCVRQEMKRCGWTDGHLLVHIQEQFGMSNTIQLDCLANGATGIWMGISEAGAALGHASSCLTIMNLIRIGNKKILEKFNCTKLREASRAITRITTGNPPTQKRPIVGSRALDVVFRKEPCKTNFTKEFSLPDFLGENDIVRITALSTPLMVMKKLECLFGKDCNFTVDRARRMKQKMMEDSRASKREEYNSSVGMATLYERSGGRLTEVMKADIEKAKASSAHITHLMNEIRELWDEWDIRDGVKDGEVDLDAFYNGFMAPYFGCYRSDESKKALRAIDVDADGNVHWDEFALYLKWAGNQYPSISTAEELLDISFRRGLVPAMQYEISKDIPIRIYIVEGEDADYYKTPRCGDDASFMGTHSG